jgi:acetolactate synthase I/II/III large subunit
MPKRSDAPRVHRRSFLKGAALGAVALTPPVAASAQTAAPKAAAAGAMPPNLARENHPPAHDGLTQSSGGGDFMIDVLRSLDIEYIATNPASSFRGLHESIVNYAHNKNPELLTCTHEEVAVAMAHGYAKIAGKPMGVLAHGTVGLQHAAMALYNAWCDRAPVYMMIGNIVDGSMRTPWVEWAHAAQDPAVIVRDFLKWDDQPASLQQFAESAVRAYKIAMTPPYGPVLLSLDAELQENPIAEDAKLRIPKLPRTAPPQGDAGGVDEAAALLVGAEAPVLIADRLARTPAGMARLVELAELLQAPVVDTFGRMNFPSRHPLNHTHRARSVVAQADVIIGLETLDFWGQTHAYRDQIHRSSRPITKPTAKTVSIGVGDLYLKANYQNFQRFADVDLAIAADGEATLPALIEAVKRRIDGDRKTAFEARGKKLTAAWNAMIEEARNDAAVGWDASPITTARLAAELWQQVRNDDWSLLSANSNFQSLWPQRLWNFDKHHRFIGGSGGAGIGYGAPAALGAALANRPLGRLSVTIQGDGDLMYAPGTLWTAAHHKIPLLYVVHNNRCYNQERMYLQAMAARHGRGIENADVGTTLKDPHIDYATVAKGFGVYAEGPVTEPKDLRPALQRAIAVVKRGEPALVDVVAQAR